MLLSVKKFEIHCEENISLQSSVFVLYSLNIFGDKSRIFESESLLETVNVLADKCAEASKKQIIEDLISENEIGELLLNNTPIKLKFTETMKTA